VEQFLNELAGVTGDLPAEPVVRALLASAVDRLHLLCTTLLFRSYPRLIKPPLNLHADELLSSVVERLLKAMRGCVRRPSANASHWPTSTCVGSLMTWPDA
jgi:RNA polymerase sigma-70 factor (ECF subfamily)